MFLSIIGILKSKSKTSLTFNKNMIWSLTRRFRVSLLNMISFLFKSSIREKTDILKSTIQITMN